jgi:hypothetical protein
MDAARWYLLLRHCEYGLGRPRRPITDGVSALCLERTQQVCPKANLIRLADDFITTGMTKELLEHDVKPLVEAFLRERGLTLRSWLYSGESEVDRTGPARDVGALQISRCEKGLRRADGQFIIGICCCGAEPSSCQTGSALNRGLSAQT